MHWNNEKPIYQQLREKIIHAILEGVYREGEVIYSIRKISTQYNINPLTVSRAYQCLVNDKILVKKRGIGMVVNEGARLKLLLCERNNFLKNEWPKIKEKINRLDIGIEELLR